MRKRNKKKEKVLYMFKNSKILKLMIKKIEKTKNIYVKNYKKVSSIYDKGLLKCVKFSDNKTSKYNLGEILSNIPSSC